MSEVYLIIAAPWQYRPSQGTVRSILSVLPRCGLVEGAPTEETTRHPDGRQGTYWTWSAGPAVALELDFPGCEQVTLSVTDWLQPMMYPQDITCLNGHPLHNSYLEAIFVDGTSPSYHCHVCAARGSVLGLDPDSPHYWLMASRLWLRLDHAIAEVPECLALSAVRRVLGLDQLEFGQFPIAW